MAQFIGDENANDKTVNIPAMSPLPPFMGYPVADHSAIETLGPSQAMGNDSLYGGDPALHDFVTDPTGNDNDPVWGAGNDLLQGYGGSDVLYGGAEDDILFGHARPGQESNGGADASDTLYGGAGNDWLSADWTLGNDGDDTLDGGDGDNDTAVLVGAQLDYTFSGTATDFTATRMGASETETLRNIEWVTFNNAFSNSARVAVATLLPDTTGPGVTVEIADTALNDLDNSSQVTFNFTEAIAPASFTQTDVSVANGVLSGFSVAADGLTATATFTATDNINATGSVSVAANTFTDVAGNLNPASSTDTVAINTTNVDTTGPGVTVEIADTALNDLDNSSQVTFNFTEAIALASFTQTDVSVANGVLSGFSVAADGLTATATFTATDNINATGSVSVAANTFTDVAGNLNPASSTDTVAINTLTSSIIEGGPGPDTLRGTPNNDIMDGKEGNDTLFGSAGADQMIGSSGRDTVRYTRTVTLDLENGDRNTGQARGDAFDSIERFQFSNGSDKGFGDADANQFFGGSGNDRLHGAGGNDVLRGENGNDRLFGEEGNDRLFGGNGRDLLVGGLGRDRMNGDAGADRYDFNTVQESSVGSQRDVVYFSGRDRIDLRTIDADEDTLGNQAFRWVNRNDLDAAFTGRDGQLRFSNGVLRGDTDGDRVADFEIRVVGFFSSGDVIL